jgi:hypothetical protein
MGMKKGHDEWQFSNDNSGSNDKVIQYTSTLPQYVTEQRQN